MILTKQVSDDLRLLLPSMQMAAYASHEFCPVGRPALAEPVGLDVLVQQLVGIQLRAVARHPYEPQSRLVLVYKALGLAGFVHRVPVHDQIDPAVELLEQPLHELHKDGRFELALEYHEGQGSLVGNRGDHVAAKAAPGGPNHGGFPYRSIAGTRDMVAAQSHLITPIDYSLLPLGLPGNRRIFPLQPARDGRIVSLIGAPHRLLRTEAPGLKVAPHGDQRDLDPVFPRNQAGHRRARPQIERQFQLIGHLAHDQRADVLGALCAQTSLPRTPSPALELKRPQTAFPVKSHPFAHRPQARSERARRLALHHPTADRLHYLTTQQMQSRGLQFPGIISFVHARYDSTLRTIL